MTVREPLESRANESSEGDLTTSSATYMYNVDSSGYSSNSVDNCIAGSEGATAPELLPSCCSCDIVGCVIGSEVDLDFNHIISSCGRATCDCGPVDKAATCPNGPENAATVPAIQGLSVTCVPHQGNEADCASFTQPTAQVTVGSTAEDILEPGRYRTEGSAAQTAPIALPSSSPNKRPPFQITPDQSGNTELSSSVVDTSITNFTGSQEFCCTCDCVHIASEHNHADLPADSNCPQDMTGTPSLAGYSAEYHVVGSEHYTVDDDNDDSGNTAAVFGKTTRCSGSLTDYSGYIHTETPL